MAKTTKKEGVDPGQNETNEVINNVTEQLLSSFKEYLIKDNKSPTTTESYLRDVTGYLQFIQKSSNQSIISIESVRAYWESMIHSAYKAATINTKLNSLHSFNKCLVEGNVVNEILVDIQALRVTTLKLIELRTAFKGEGQHD